MGETSTMDADSMPIPSAEWTSYSTLVLSELHRLADGYENQTKELQALRLEVSLLHKSLEVAETNQATMMRRVEDHEGRVRLLENASHEEIGRTDYIRWLWPAICSAVTAFGLYFTRGH